MIENQSDTIRVIQADLDSVIDQDAVLSRMDQYSRDPMGDGKALSTLASAELIEGLRGHETTMVLVAWQARQPVGIAACFRGFSTFAAKPLIYVSDFFVLPNERGRGIGKALLEAVEVQARALGCCKITLEVQENNQRARSIYQSFGFGQAVYVPQAGPALALSKKLI